MNKTTIGYIKTRVEEVVKCTNGKISTKQNRRKKGTGLTNAAKFRQIRDGRAELIPDYDIANTGKYYNRNGADALFEFFTFQTTEKQKEKIAFNKAIDSAVEEMHTSVELAGKRLVDSVVLGIIEQKDLPEELEKLARMFEANI